MQPLCSSVAADTYCNLTIVNVNIQPQAIASVYIVNLGTLHTSKTFPCNAVFAFITSVYRCHETHQFSLESNRFASTI
jgi:hypothetical protein